MLVYEIRKLVLSGDVCPYDEWFLMLNPQDQYMVDNRMLRVRLGLFGETNRVGDGVSELKFRKGCAIRIYYSLIARQIILIICAGDKRTQKRDIVKAKELLRRYKEIQ